MTPLIPSIPGPGFNSISPDIVTTTTTITTTTAAAAAAAAADAITTITTNFLYTTTTFFINNVRLTGDPTRFDSKCVKRGQHIMNTPLFFIMRTERSILI